MQKNEIISYLNKNSKVLRFKHETETVTLLEDNIGEKLPDGGLGNYFLDISAKAEATKAKVDKRNFIK